MDISSFNFQDAQNNLNNAMSLMPTISGFIFDINNILNLFKILFQQIQQSPTRTSISGVGYTDISNYYIRYIPPVMSYL